MPVMSSKLATATWDGTAIPEVFEVSADRSDAVQSYASTTTSGKIARISGNRDVIATVVCGFDLTGAANYPDEGAIATLVLTRNGTSNIFSGSAIVIRRSERASIRDGSILEITYEFGQA